MKRILLVCAIFVFTGISQAAAPARVVAVLDGDTIVVDSAGKTITVRLIGIDAPELLDHQQNPTIDGQAAATALQRLVQGQWLHLESDELVPPQDGSGRTLAYLYRGSDGLFVNRQLVADGYAVVFRAQSFRFSRDFLALESAARLMQRGLWNPNPLAREWEARFSGVKYLGEANPGPAPRSSTKSTRPRPRRTSRPRRRR